MTTATQLSGEHAQDVLGQLLAWRQAREPSALILVTSTEGGAVRARGAMMAVGPEAMVGYISGGCIDADVALQARAACEDGQPRALRYGAGSPFVDLPLPCGGAIEVLILPEPDQVVLEAAHAALFARQQVDLAVSRTGALCVRDLDTPPGTGDFVFTYTPKLRLRIAGRGADALALARIADAAGYATRLQLVDEEDLDAARQAGLSQVEKLTTPGALADADDDPWTAFVLLFHDRDWEVPLLQQALSGPAFYIGAVGSARTHANRCDALRAAGCDDRQIAHVHGPIGLVGSLRDASMLAVSVLAEIVSEFPAKSVSRRPRTAYLLLAAGSSSRFEAGDKLMADLNGRPVLAWSADSVPADETSLRIAIVPPDYSARSDTLRAAGWQIVENEATRSGQASSLKRGLAALERHPDVDQIIVLLGDMPFVPVSHFDALRERAQAASITAILSDSNGRLSPPALFKRVHFDNLGHLTGDRGAKALFNGLNQGRDTIALDPEHAVDIDQVADLTRLEETAHA